MKIINPYDGIDWNNIQDVASVSHQHCTSQAVFNILYNNGVRHFAISNYYPSKPIYPLDSVFDITGKEDVISCPNAEHTHSIYGGSISYNIHINGIGSFFESGKPQGETPIGVNGTWQYAVNSIFNNLQYADGGGATFNHPKWTTANGGLDVFDFAKLFLDYDARCLGIEIYNQTSDELFTPSLGWDLDLWDRILLTGRRCWGFCVPDHGRTRGRNILLVNSIDEHSCLKAYRNGCFFGKINQSDLRFTKIQFSANKLNVSTTNADTIVIVVDGIKKSYSASELSVDIIDTATYVRIEAYRQDDAIFSNPIILKPYKKRKIKIWQFD